MLTYKSATQSGIIGIAYHYNLPVLASDRGGMREMIEPYNTGIIIKNPEPSEIAKSVESFFNSDEDYFENIDKFKEKASWESLANFITNLA